MNRSVGCGQAACPFCTASNFSCKSLPRASRSFKIRRPDSYSSDGETYAHGEGSLAPGGPYETYTLERQDDGIELGVLLTRLEFGPYRRHTATVF